MSAQILSIVLDIAVLFCFAFTVFYVLKLSKSLNAFRQTRDEMNGIIQTLSKNIDEALRAIDGLKAAGDGAGKRLQKIVSEAKAMADELQMVNETSNSLASRLENLADRNRVVAQTFETPASLYDEPSAPPQRSSVEKPAFFIQDREFGIDETPDDEDMPEDLQSQAEKELLAALRKNKKSGRTF